MHLADEGVESDPYKLSMLVLLDYIGLRGYGTPEATMPARSAAEQEQIARHLPDLEGQVGAGALDLTRPGDAPPTIYLSPEETVEWKAFLAGIPVEARHAASVRRRLSLTLWRAHTRGVCLWCWFPMWACMCAKLRASRAELPSAALDGAFGLTLVLHAEEVLRSTNTGHLSAYLLGAPLRVWGVPADDAALAGLQPTTTTTTTTTTNDDDDVSPAGGRQGASRGATCRVHHLLLYPEKGAPDLGAFVRERLRVEAGRPPCAAPADKFHFILLDSTWGQALSLNRHISRRVPRVSMTIRGEYEALFSALRKRTRASGVSTFEAVSIAAGEHLEALGMPDASARAVRTLTAAMKAFVDLRCLLKFTEPQFTREGDGLRELVEHRDRARRQEAQHRQALLQASLRTGAAARGLLPPPVLNYCYCCERFIGWHHAPEHVLGRRHHFALRLNPTCRPSEATKGCFMANVSSASRGKRPGEGGS